MELKYVLIGAAIAVSLSSPFAIAADNAAAEDEQAEPKLYGNVRLQYETREDGKDDNFRVGRASVGVKGPLKYDNFKALYDVELELSDIADPETASDNREAKVRNAYILMPNEKWGTVFLGRGPSGQRTDLYGHLDIFENTEVYSPAGGTYTQSNGLTAQGLNAPGSVVWKSPSFGGFYVAPALGYASDANGKSLDIKALRAIYKKDRIQLGAGVVVTDESLLPGANDYKRTALAASYKADRWQAGATLEDNQDHPSGDFSVLGVAGSVKATPKVDLKLGYFNKNHDNNALDNNAVISNITYTIGSNPKQGKAAKLFLENESHDIDTNNKTTAGISLSF